LRGQCIEADSSASEVQPFVSVGSPHPGSVKKTDFAVEQEFRRKHRIQRKPQRLRQVVAASGGKNAQHDVLPDANGVGKLLKCSVATQRKNARGPGSYAGTRLCCQIFGACGKAKVYAPTNFSSKPLDARSGIAGNSSTRHRIQQDQVRKASGLKRRR
jgi:hypothetical protein